MTLHTVKQDAPRTQHTGRKDGLYRIHCPHSTSGDISGYFCKFCRNQCENAGKTIDEILELV